MTHEDLKLECRACGNEIDLSGDPPFKCHQCGGEQFEQHVPMQLARKANTKKEVKIKAPALPPAKQLEEEPSGLMQSMRALMAAAENAGSVDELINELERLHPSSEKLSGLLDEALGGTGAHMAYALFGQCALSSVGAKDVFSLRTALEAINGLEPQGTLQGMLAAQMIAVHFASMGALTSIASNDLKPEAVEQRINRAIKLARTFSQQAELFARLQGKITSQKVVVERVNVQPGGQSIVGVVESNTRGRG
jgi:hypothetical protein